MKISVKVKAGAKENHIQDLGAGNFQIRVKVPPVEGRANEEVIRLFALHFRVPRSKVTIKSGQTAKTKILVIDPG